MTLWMVRAGRHGEQESVALEKKVVTIGWKEMPSLASIKSKEQLKELYEQTYPDAKKNSMINEVGQIWRFINDIQMGDYVALPLKSQSAIAIGEVRGDYAFERLSENVKHVRKVKWHKMIPRSAFDQDLLYSLGAFMTVCQIKRNDAEKRILALLQKKDYLVPEVADILSDDDEGDTGEIDIESFAKDQLIKFIDKKFKGHGLARLVNAILIAQGYSTFMSPPGPDGGIDILASGGSLGFDSPRICVQVKSSSTPADVRVVRELRGVMAKVKADQGLFVSWSGYKSTAQQEARDDYFRIRLWDSGDVLNAIFKHYPKFDDELKAELPLKRIWALVLEED